MTISEAVMKAAAKTFLEGSLKKRQFNECSLLINAEIWTLQLLEPVLAWVRWSDGRLCDELVSANKTKIKSTFYFLSLLTISSWKPKELKANFATIHLTLSSL